MRGKLCNLPSNILKFGITPAHAGKTLAIRIDDWENGDHPRACGENKSSSCPISGRLGSPPRMRGKQEAL